MSSFQRLQGRYLGGLNLVLYALPYEPSSHMHHRNTPPVDDNHTASGRLMGKGVLFSEVSSFQRLKCMQEWYLGWEKVSCLERCPHFRG